MPTKKKRMSLGSETTPTNNEVPEVDQNALNAFANGAAIKSTQTEPTKRKAGRPSSGGPKTINRTFSILPEDDDNIELILDAAARAGERRGKSDVIRAGIYLLKTLNDDKKIAEILKRIKKLK